MLTLRAAGDALATAHSLDHLEAIAALLGAGSAGPLDATTRHALGLEHGVADARLASGRGALRVLLLQLDDGAVRDILSRVATQLATRAPHVLWLVLATQASSHTVAIAAWSGEHRPPRLRALVADRRALVDSDAETLRALATAVGPHDLLTHTRWVEMLGRDALTARFFRKLESVVRGIASSSAVGTDQARREIALLDTSRLLFLCFLEAKGWLDGDRAFLRNQFDACAATGGGFHRKVLRPLFFGTLNTPVAQRAPQAHRFGRVPFLNGGLFARTLIERRTSGLAFSDDAYGTLLYDLFAQYRFTAAEETARWSEAAVDPEMLGRAFESFMANSVRQSTGAFFTPFSLVDHVTTCALDEALAARPLARLTVLDPACGSGALLVHVLERMANRHVADGDPRDLGAIRRDVLTRSIFGVDVNPTAVWLCQLRLWLSVVIESHPADPLAVVPLPNLDRNIRVGNALAGQAFDGDGMRPAGGAELRRLRERYTRATGRRKQSLARALDRAERQRALAAIDADLQATAHRRRDIVVARRGRDLFGNRYHSSSSELATAQELRQRAASLRALRRSIGAGGALPFSFPVHFADVAANGGFALIIGNPPWVRLHRIPPEQRAAFRRDYDVARLAAWDAGAGSAGASSGFAAQIDLAALFVERAIRLSAPNGAVALLLPAKLWRSLAGGGLRRFIATSASVRRIEDYSSSSALFDAAVYPSLAVLAHRATQPTDTVDAVVHHRGQSSFGWRVATRTLAYDDTPGAPWLLLPPDARRGFDLLRAAGPALAESPIGRPLLGVKCGCNDAFIVEVIDASQDMATVRTARGTFIAVERALLRPLLRGERLQRWTASPSAECILWTHDPLDAPLGTLPPFAHRWLRTWRTTLVNRADARSRSRWWTLFRTEGARFDRPRVVWGDVGREPRAVVLLAGNPYVPLNSCYVARCRDVKDAHALAALLNSPVARAWLDAIAEPARGNYRRYLGWTMSLLPVPTDWRRARSLLAPLGERAHYGHAPTDADLLNAALSAYRVSLDDIAPLVAWTAP